jgi:signal transduction histidine kinase
MQLEENILDVARVESGSLILNKEKFNLNEMIIKILKDFQQNIKLLYEYYYKDEIITYADRSRFYQIIAIYSTMQSSLLMKV